MKSLFKSSAWSGQSINLNIWYLAWPMILANISVPLLGFVDTAVIGHLPESHFLAGTALASLFISVLFWLLGFLRMSTTSLVARARGEKSAENAICHLYQALILALLLALVLIVLQQPLFQLLTYLSNDDVSMQATYMAAKTYFDIRIYAAPFVLANMVLTGFLIGSGKTRWVLVALLICNVVNLIADILFVPILQMGVAGVAYASVLAEVVQVCVIGFFIWPELRKVVIKARELKQGWDKLLSMNGNLFIRSALLQVCLSFMTIFATRFGSDAVAINSILMQFFLFISFSLDGVAYSLESLVGNSLGQKKRARLHAYIAQGLKIGFAFALVYSVIYWLLIDGFVWLLTDIQSLQQAIKPYYIWVYLMPLTCFMSFLFDGIYVGLGWHLAMRNTMALAAGLFFLTLLVVWPYLANIGNHALWAAFSVFMLTRGLGQAWYLKGHLKQ